MILIYVLLLKWKLNLGLYGSHYHSLGFECFYKCEDRTSLRQVFLGQRVCDLESVFTPSLILLFKLLNMALEQEYSVLEVFVG